MEQDLTPRRGPGLGLDLLLLAMVVIWAGNYSLVKAVLAEIPALAFNAVRLVIASVIFAGVWWRVRHAGVRMTARERWLVAGLGLIGHCAYQLCFVSGLARTTAANSALISGCSPIAVGILASVVGHERLTRNHWLGAALSLAGIYLVIGPASARASGSVAGDLLILASVGCWAVYTVFSQPLLERHSPLVVTTATMIVGTGCFLPFAAAEVLATDWTAASRGALAGIVLSAVFALNAAYWIWYTAVQRIGSSKTAIVSNMVPPAAMIVAAAVLGEHVGLTKWLGAAAVVGGVVLTRRN